jgi:hypothetical protein
LRDQGERGDSERSGSTGGDEPLGGSGRVSDFKEVGAGYDIEASEGDSRSSQIW